MLAGNQGEPLTCGPTLALTVLMRRSRRLSVAALCALPLALGAAASAQADAFDTVFAAYQKTGVVNPCTFTPAQLKQAKAQIPNDFEQYAPDFKDAIDAAAKQRAAGACDKQASGSAGTAAPSTGGGAPTGGTASPSGGPAAPSTSTPAGTTAAATPTTAAAPTPQPAPSVTPAPAVADGAILAAAADSDGDSGLPAPIAALFVLALLAALAGLAVAAVRWFAFEPPWLVRSRHATAEAGWRTSAAWAEFTDWLRLGR